MTTPVRESIHPTAAFLVLAGALCAIEGAVLSTSAFARRPDLLATAATLDLVPGLPAPGWVILVRRGCAGSRSRLPLLPPEAFAARLATARPGRPSGPGSSHDASP